jgi:hypothetical protein
MITDKMLKEICDRVENSLENYVLEWENNRRRHGRAN